MADVAKDVVWQGSPPPAKRTEPQRSRRPSGSSRPCSRTGPSDEVAKPCCGSRPDTSSRPGTSAGKPSTDEEPRSGKKRFAAIATAIQATLDLIPNERLAKDGSILRKSTLHDSRYEGGVREKIIKRRMTRMSLTLGQHPLCIHDHVHTKGEGDSESSFYSSSESENEEEDIDDGPKWGMLLDMLRRRTQGKTIKTVLSEMVEGDPKLYGYTKDAVLRDEFVAIMHEDITKFYKGATLVGAAGKLGNAWSMSTFESLRDKVRRIITYKREVKCLNAEVHNFMFSYKLRNAQAPPEFEAPRERMDRMSDFWTQYHLRLRRNNLPPIDAASRSAKSSTSIGWNSPKVAPKRAMCFSGEDQWNMIERIEDKGKKHHRHASSNHSTRNSLLGSLHGIKSPSHSRNARMQTLALTEEATELPQLCSTASSSAFRPGMGSSSSMPNLHSGDKSSVAASMKGRTVQLPRIAQSSRGLNVAAKSPTNSYLEACERCWIVPTPLPFVTGHSWRLQAANRDLLDNDLRAVAPMIQEVDSIQEVDLAGNTMLTEKALVPFFERLFGEPAASTLEKLILRDVKHIGLHSMEIIRCLISENDGAKNLKVFDISHVRIAPKCHLMMAKAIDGHGCIENINISDTSLGSQPWIAKQCVPMLMAAPVRILDISWNCFDADVFQHLGECLAAKKIERLSVSNCSSACLDINTPTPISFFLEWLSQDEALTSLDVSLNRIDFRAMLIIEDSLATHKKLSKLDVANNPFGVLGMRSALRLLSLSTNALVHFDSSGCYGGSVKGAQTFSMTNPGGRYSLEMDRPYHRSILRMLYKTCDRFKQPPEQAFLSVQYSKSAWMHAQKNAKGQFDVPIDGSFKCIFNIESAIENSITDIASEDFAGFLDRHSMITKIQPPFKKIIPLFASWKELDGRSIEQNVFLNAMSHDFCLQPAHLEHMCRSSPVMASEIIFRLLPCVTGGQASPTLGMMLIKSAGGFVRMHQRIRTCLDFNVENPTGHYKLELSSCEHSIAEMLLLLDRWEVVLGRRQNRRDCSQRGNRSHIRNEHYQNKPIALEHSTIAEWTLPECEDLEFDYTSGKRCSPDAVIINEQTFNNILVSLYDAECTPEAKLEALRLISHHLHMTALQMRELLGSFRSESHRAEAFVTFYLRIVDMWNAKVFQVRFSDKAELSRLQDRLGYATCFPFVQPENAVFELDYSMHDQRLCANLLLALASKESMHNLREFSFTLADGTVDPLPLGVPRAWDKFEKMPTSGVFKVSYQCAPENRKFSTRSSLGESYGAFPMNVKEDHVMWWTGLTEATDDVLDWLEFCIGKFKTMGDAFVAIDGEDGNGVITLREFEDGLKDMKCKKFKGKDEAQRIAAVFRYLDPGGEGTVSREEWAVLDQLAKEYHLCISEFVQFLQRTFGNDLRSAWEFLDGDASGELDLEEWMHAVDGIGYFGPAKCVFGLLDNSDDGNISLDEFIVLEAYKKQ